MTTFMIIFLRDKSFKSISLCIFGFMGYWKVVKSSGNKMMNRAASESVRYRENIKFEITPWMHVQWCQAPLESSIPLTGKSAETGKRVNRKVGGDKIFNNNGRYSRCTWNPHWKNAPILFFNDHMGTKEKQHKFSSKRDENTWEKSMHAVKDTSAVVLLRASTKLFILN